MGTLYKLVFASPPAWGLLPPANPAFLAVSMQLPLSQFSLTPIQSPITIPVWLPPVCWVIGQSITACHPLWGWWGEFFSSVLWIHINSFQCKHTREEGPGAREASHFWPQICMHFDFSPLIIFPGNCCIGWISSQQSRDKKLSYLSTSSLIGVLWKAP